MFAGRLFRSVQLFAFCLSLYSAWDPSTAMHAMAIRSEVNTITAEQHPTNDDEEGKVIVYTEWMCVCVHVCVF